MAIDEKLTKQQCADDLARIQSMDDLLKGMRESFQRGIGAPSTQSTDTQKRLQRYEEDIRSMKSNHTRRCR